MRHRTVVPSLLTLALVAIGSRAPLSSAEEGTSKTFAEKNFRWTVPAGWSLEEAEGENKDAGYVCIARKEETPSKGASAWALVVDAGGSSLETLVTKATENKKQKLNDADSLPPGRTDWAGVRDARVVQINGKMKENGSAVQHRVYSAIVDGKLHQLDVKTWNGAEADLMTDLDAVAAGYRVLKGGSSTKAGGDGPAPSDGGGSGDAPQGDGDPKKVRFDKLGLTWTLPSREGIRNFAFSNRMAPDTVIKEKTVYRVAQAALDGDGPAVEIQLEVRLAQPGSTSKDYINKYGEDFFDDMAKENFTGAPVPNLDEDYKVGNWHGSMKSLTGKDKAGKPLMIRTIFSVLRENLYHLTVTAHDKGETPAEGQIRESVGGLKWDDTAEGVRGPIVCEFPSITSVRPETTLIGSDKTFTVMTKPNISIKKPGVMGALKWDARTAEFNTWHFAMEGRKPGAYLFGAKRYTDNMLRGSTPPLTAEGLIDDLEGKWKNSVEDPKTQLPNGANKIADTFAGIKGQRYEFSGTFEGHPYVERGWLIRPGTDVLFIRMQFGGKDAEAAFAAEAKTLIQSFKVK